MLDESVAAADVCFHEATLPSVDRSVEAPLDAHAINTGATVELLECACRHDMRIVTASSAAIYGIPADLPLTGTAPKEPAIPYGIDKLAIDHYTRRYHDLCDHDTVILRYFNIFGPRQTDSEYAGVIPIFLEQARNDKPILNTTALSITASTESDLLAAASNVSVARTPSQSEQRLTERTVDSVFTDG